MLARSQLRIIIVASLAGLLFGFDTAVISGVTQDLRTTFSLSPAGLGVAVSTALWGTLFGAMTLGKPGDRFGSRELLKFIGLLYLLAAAGCALAWSSCGRPTHGSISSRKDSRQRSSRTTRTPA
jgi:MFS family permease